MLRTRHRTGRPAVSIVKMLQTYHRTCNPAVPCSGSAVRHASVARHVTDCATRPGVERGREREREREKEREREGGWVGERAEREREL